MQKPAPADLPVADAIRARWSPRAYDPTPLSAEDVDAILEAGRWAASSSNAQPWSFLVASIDQPEEHARMLEMLNPFNQAWARNAPLLMISVARLDFPWNGNSNPHAWHDVGAATTQMLLEAASRGLQGHVMGGILPEKIVETYGIPDGYSVVAGVAFGRVGALDALSPELQQRELAPRVRRPRSEFVFSGRWGSAR